MASRSRVLFFYRGRVNYDLFKHSWRVEWGGFVVSTLLIHLLILGWFAASVAVCWKLYSIEAAPAAARKEVNNETDL